jgi:uncharacterized lipoprotein NlpE involved in copper resistance
VFYIFEEKRIMNSFKKLIIALVLIVSVLGTVGCEEKGEDEKAGVKMDKAMEDASKKASDLLGK